MDSLQGFLQAVHKIDCLMQDCSNSSALAMKLLLSSSKPSKYEQQFIGSYFENPRIFDNTLTHTYTLGQMVRIVMQTAIYTSMMTI